MGRKWTLDSAIDKNFDVVIKMKSLFSSVTCPNESTTNSSTVINLGNGTAAKYSEKNIVKNSTLQEYEFKYTGGSAGTNSTYTIKTTDGYDAVKIYFDTGQLEFFVLTTPPIEGEDNIEVMFAPKEKGNNYPIIHSSIGTQFGAEGYSDRLFLAGFSGNKNTLWYSAFNDFTYFPFPNYITLGNSSNEIVAFSRLSDSTLAVHKAKNAYEPTIYYITYGEITLDKETRTVFTVKTGTMGETPISNFTNFNLAGDNLFLSENGVYGIQLSENISSNERYALERSSFINSKLKKYNDLKNAKAIVYKNRYYLAIEGDVFVADARFKSSAKDGDMKDTFNYEWWFWKNVPVKEWVIIDDKLCFVSTNGKLAEFYDGYEDINSVKVETGDMAKQDDYTIAYNQKFDDLIRDDTEIKFYSTIELAILEASDIKTIEDGKVYINHKDLDKFSLGDSYFIGKSSTNIGVILIEKNEEFNYLKFTDGSSTFTEYTGMKRISYYKDTFLYICEHDSFNHTFCLTNKENGEKMKIINSSLSAGEFLIKNNVVSEWYSQIENFDTSIYSKNLLSVTLVFEPTVEGRVKFGYRTRNKEIRKESDYKATNGVDFTDTDFTNFSFVNGFATSRTLKTRTRNFNYIQFKVISDDGKDFALNNFTVLYNIGKKNKGVR